MIGREGDSGQSLKGRESDVEKPFETAKADDEPVRILAAQLAVTPSNLPQEMRGYTWTIPHGPLEWGDAHQ